MPKTETKKKGRAEKDVLLGAHVSAAGGPLKALERALQIGCTAMQIFVKGNTRWEFPPLDSAEAQEFCRRRNDTAIKKAFAHSIYLVNLATSDPLLRKKSIEDMIDELQRCDALGLEFLVVHPGSHGGAGSEAGIKRVAKALDEIYERLPDCQCKICLETTAGQGSALGADFRELNEIIERVASSRRLGICLDTAHVFAAGYDIRTPEGYVQLWEDFDRFLGRDRLCALHLNDSKAPCGSRVDRHEHIGKGQIGTTGFRFFMQDKRLRGIPMVIETPKGPDMKEDVENLAVLRSLVSRGANRCSQSVTKR